MTIEQAISNLKRAKCVPYKKETLAIAIKVLEETQNIHDKCMRCVEFSMFKPLPELGHWSRKTKVDTYDIEGVKTWGIKCQCDRCTFTTIVVEDFGYYSYCPNCGAKMEVET